MVVLKKIKSATIVEVLVASAIIVIVFTIASLSLNNVFRGVVKGNDTEFHNRLKELSYFAKHRQLPLPHYEDNEQWDIAIERRNGSITLEAIHKASQKETLYTLYEANR